MLTILGKLRTSSLPSERALHRWRQNLFHLGHSGGGIKLSGEEGEFADNVTDVGRNLQTVVVTTLTQFGYYSLAYFFAVEAYLYFDRLGKKNSRRSYLKSARKAFKRCDDSYAF